MPELFISYRRSDSQETSLRLHQALVNTFGQEQVFIDRHSMPLGTHFPSFLSNKIHSADAVLIVFGKEWANCLDDRGNRRLALSSDYVRKEVELSLFKYQNQLTPVIPVAVNGATLEDLSELPQEIQLLSQMNGEVINPTKEAEDTEQLIRRLLEIPESGKQALNGTKQIPSIAKYSVDLSEKLNKYGSFYGFLPSDAVIRIRKLKDGKWERQIASSLDPSQNRYWDSTPLSDLTHAPIAHVVGTFIEWYGVSAEQCEIWREPYRPKGWLGYAHDLFGKKEEGEWQPTHPTNVYYTRLYDILKAFNVYFYYRPPGLCDVMPQPGELIHPNYRVFGMTRNPEENFFGEYICTITADLGGEDHNSGELYYCPTAPETNLQYVNVFQKPYLNVTPHAHIGRDEAGFHIVHL